MATERPRFALERTAQPEDIDELGHVNNAVYVRWIQDVATAHWAAAASAEMIAAFVWVVTRHEIDYRRPTLAGDTVRLETWVGTPQGARFDRHVEIAGTGGEIRVAARSWWACLDRETMRPVRIRPELVAPFLA